jgi:hypothetical protein
MPKPTLSAAAVMVLALGLSLTPDTRMPGTIFVTWNGNTAGLTYCTLAVIDSLALEDGQHKIRISDSFERYCRSKHCVACDLGNRTAHVLGKHLHSYVTWGFEKNFIERESIRCVLLIFSIQHTGKMSENGKLSSTPHRPLTWSFHMCLKAEPQRLWSDFSTIKSLQFNMK